MEPLYSPGAVKRILAEHGLRPSKSLGQNFLIDKNTIDRIVTAVDPTEGDWILEIGPGLGALTQGLAESGAHVVAVEKDGNLARLLKARFAPSKNVRIVHGDALEVDIASLLPEERPRIKVVGNLPYYITSSLIVAVLESALPLERVVVMIQREVADRLKASPGTKAYGALTVAVRARMDVESIGRVPPTVFIPAPGVESEVIRLTPRSEALALGDPKIFRLVVKAAFGMRRKTLRNAMKGIELEEDRLKREEGEAGQTVRETVLACMATVGIDPDRRGETLSVEEFAILSRALSERCVCYN